MFANRPVGLTFLVQAIPKRLLPVAVVLVLQKLQPALLQVRYGWPFVYFFTLSLTLFAKQIYWKFTRNLEMRRLGSQPLPEVPSSMPLGIELISKSLKSFTEDYMGILFGFHQ